MLTCFPSNDYCNSIHQQGTQYNKKGSAELEERIAQVLERIDALSKSAISIPATELEKLAKCVSFKAHAICTF